MPAIILSSILIALIAYLWGSIPSGYWLGKILRGKDFDIRNHGSRKIGATNVLRTLGKGPAAIVFLVDISKGVGPALVALLVPALNAGGWGPSIAGILALLGHCYPVFIGFKGGRGVSTGAGALLIISPIIFLISLIVTAITIATSRFVSLGSILGSACMLLCGVLFFVLTLANPAFPIHIGIQQLLFLIIAPTLVILFHIDNIKRLLSGTERKIGQRVDTSTTTPAP
ncbi:glycerol-3-phosphate 1-O-acyltransferase PlsY [Ktedonospora formicarum]|uniref:Glycerol-3-phosphate acyltransferase n=1 Tax=Ktedonospora formicarum TaxID=2778364 RepID=A0A8J3HZP0_9CHLR|nr:glycerol-3-phosphate 1-O-acyltransferase PlsY [Ktedonospora formicarum]GHO43597.1 glycerol-3-phosphate acyltransferase [Ktedonospora formicarum]